MFSDLATSQEHLIIVGQKEATFVELDDELFMSGSGVVLPVRRSSPADKRPPAVAILAAAVRHAQQRRGLKVLVAGHTRARGEASILRSRDRSAYAHALLTGERTRFADFDAGLCLDGQDRDRSAILDWVASEMGWPCSKSADDDDMVAATSRFQESYNRRGKAGNTSAADLSITGAFDSHTWCAVYDCYRHQMAAALEVDLNTLDSWSAELVFVDKGQPFVGCSGYKPLGDMDFDLYQSQTDARVEVLFFQSGQEPEVPCFSGKCTPRACEMLDARWYKASRVSPTAPHKTLLRIQLHDWLSAPCADTPCKVALSTGQVLETTTSATGWLQQQIPGGKQELTVSYTPPGGSHEISIKVAAMGGIKAEEYYLAQLRHFGLEYSSPRQTVYRFQQAAGIELTGLLDAATRARVDQIIEGEDDALKTWLGRDNG